MHTQSITTAIDHSGQCQSNGFYVTYKGSIEPFSYQGNEQGLNVALEALRALDCEVTHRVNRANYDPVMQDTLLSCWL